MIPSTDVGEGDLHTEIRLDELRQLAQAVAETALGIVGSRSWCVFSGIGRSQHLHSVKRLLASTVEDAVRRVIVHGFKSAGGGRSFGIATADGEVADVVHGDGRLGTAENAWKRWTQRNCAESRFLIGWRQVA